MVLDTQVWIDWLVFDDASTLALRAAAERAEIVIDAACEAELARVTATTRNSSSSRSPRAPTCW
jgi:hypothetical protein